MNDYKDDIIILRCCRDWPIHRSAAYTTNGRCGICRKIPQVIHELYVKEKFAKNQNKPS